jgi:hypothetical protein
VVFIISGNARMAVRLKSLSKQVALAEDAVEAGFAAGIEGGEHDLAIGQVAIPDWALSGA